MNSGKTAPLPPPPPASRTRWIIHVAILLVPISLAIFSFSIGREARLPQTGFGLFKFLCSELLMWGLAFAAAFKISQITVAQLCLSLSHPFRQLLYGIGYFLVIRTVVFVILIVQFIWIPPVNLSDSSETVFSMMDPHGMVKHPAFSLTVFGLTAVIAGVTEELWRVGMLKGLQAIFPRLQASRLGILCNIAIVSVIFGVAHLYLGWLGVENAILLGFCFGLIVMYRKSYWEAAIAHTLFDALSFGLIALIVFNPQILTAALVAEVSKGNTTEIGHVLKLGADINGTFGPKGSHPLEVAAREGKSDVVAYLLEKGADPNLADNTGETPLMAAASKINVESIKFLVNKGAKLDTMNNKGQTALHFAMVTDNAPTVQLLIDLGASVNLKDNKGRTPLAFALKNGFQKSAAILEKNGGT